MENMNFDIDDYSIFDIENFFGLGDTSMYNLSGLLKILDPKIKDIKNKINSSKMKHEEKIKIFNFLENAKNIMVSQKQIEGNIEDNNYQITNNLHSKLEKNVIEHSDKQFIYTNNSNYYAGIINPLNKRIITNYLLIDSKFRENYDTTNSSNFIVNLPTRLNNVVSIQLSSFEIPITFYGISANYGNNLFQIVINYFDENNIETTISKNIIVPDGNYNPFIFIETINNLISPRDEDGNLLDIDDIFGYISVKVDLTENYSGTGKVTFMTEGAKANLITSFEIKFIKPYNCNDTKFPLSTRIGYNFGFTKEEYKGEKKYVSEMIIEPATIRYFYLAIDDYNNNNNNNQYITVYKNSTTLTSSIIAKISVKSSYFSLIMENDLNITTEPRDYFGPVNLQKLQVYLLDDHGRILDMTQGNFSFTLLVKRLYDL
jgi:hypothetical protein